MKQIIDAIVQKIESHTKLFVGVLAFVLAVAATVEIQGRGSDSYLEVGLEVIGRLPGLLIFSAIAFVGVLHAAQAVRNVRARRAEKQTQMKDMQAQIERLQQELAESKGTAAG